MRADEIRYLLQALGCVDIRTGARYVNASCPFARVTHRGADSHPSFGVSIVPDGESRYKCLGCNVKGNLTGLVWAVEGMLGYKLPAVHEFVRTRNVESIAALRVRLERDSRRAESVGGDVTGSPMNLPGKGTGLTVLPESSLYAFEFLPREAMGWKVFTKRKLTYETLRAWGILWHPQAKRIGLPVRDADRRLLGITGRLGDDERCPRCGGAWKTVQVSRPVRQPGWSGTEIVHKTLCAKCGKPSPPKYLHSTGFRKDFSLFGEHMLPKEKCEGCIVEGHFDAIALWQAGFHAVAVMGSSLGFEQAAKITRHFSSVTIVPDGDGAGGEIAYNLWRALSPRLPVRVADMPEGRDPDEVGDDVLRSLVSGAWPGEVFAAKRASAGVELFR